MNGDAGGPGNDGSRAGAGATREAIQYAGHFLGHFWLFWGMKLKSCYSIGCFAVLRDIVFPQKINPFKITSRGQFRGRHSGGPFLDLVELPPSAPVDGHGGLTDDKVGSGSGGGGWLSKGVGDNGGALKGGVGGGMGKITKNSIQEHGLVSLCITEGDQRSLIN